MSLVLNDLLGAYNTLDTFVIHGTVLFIIAAVEIISISSVGIKKPVNSVQTARHIYKWRH